MFKFFFIFLTVAAMSFPIGFEYPNIYRDYRALGMGNAFNAVGGSFSAVFYNPAGLSNLKEEDGLYVNLFPITFSVSSNIFSVANDIRKALESKSDVLILDTIKKYRGEVVHGYISLLPSISLKRGKTAFGAGVVFASKVNGILHHGGGTDGLYELENIIYGGPIVGLSYDRNKLSFGGSFKYLLLAGVNDTFRITEVTAPNFDMAKYIKHGSDFSFDMGLIYKLDSKGEIYPQIGISLINITGIYVKDVIDIPMTANFGFSMRSSPKEGFLKEWTVGIDYVDIFMAYKDKDILKRIRIGAEGKIISGNAGDITLRGGIYSGQITAGVEFNLLIFTVAYTTYAEEIGAKAFQQGSRRHLLYINVGW